MSPWARAFAAAWLGVHQTMLQAESQAEPTTVVVRVYRTVALPERVEVQALAEARAALAGASVRVRWVRCSAGDEAGRDSACGAPLAGDERVVRIIAGGALASPRRAVLGDALVAPHVQTGVLATVYYDRVFALAENWHADVATLLGRVVAHELVHLLAVSSGHAAGGLMRAVWEPGRRQNAPGDEWRPSVADIRGQ
jgi:hypothetical protein